jgi:hypothetical protein
MLVSGGGLIFHVSDVDRFWAYLMEKGFHPDSPQDAANQTSVANIIVALRLDVSIHLPPL